MRDLVASRGDFKPTEYPSFPPRTTMAFMLHKKHEKPSGEPVRFVCGIETWRSP